jgi:hypothetical protein
MAVPKIVIDDESALRIKEIIQAEHAEQLYVRLEASPG